jgi:hypothetical protein
VGFDGGLRFAVLVCRRKDAEGDRDAGFKVQIDDFCRHERIFSYNLSKRTRRKDDKKDPLALVPGKQKSKKRREKRKETGLLCILFCRVFLGEESEAVRMMW